MASEINRVPKSILIVSPSWLGDAIIALPALEKIKSEHPATELSILTKPQLQEFWRLTKIAGRIEIQSGGARGTWRTALRLRSLKIDRCYIIPNSFRSAAIPWLARIPERIGFRGHFRSALLSEIRGANLPPDLHQSCEVMTLVTNVAVQELEIREPLIEIDNSVAAAAKKKFKLDDGVVAIFPGAARGPSKCWPEQRYCELGMMIALRGRSIVVLGSQAERGLCERIAASIGPRARNLAGLTGLSELAAVLKNCAAVVANDSGGMHLAAAVGVPVVAVYGITDSSKTGPLGIESHVLQNSDIRARDIPRDSRIARKCLESIAVESVYRALDPYLN